MKPAEGEGTEKATQRGKKKKFAKIKEKEEVSHLDSGECKSNEFGFKCRKKWRRS